ncbi:hypothetical protein [Rothia sp. (in: high G+C Gram-positive bacteria)]|uniref:hypothetical protein n=1 Tax=Rothia sp. (in: high G+C Gram-positive bacteria) TaxID=1885016 RepID=UPI003216AE63
MTELNVSRGMSYPIFVLQSMRHKLRQYMLKTPEGGKAFIEAPVGTSWLFASWSINTVKINLSGAHADIPAYHFTSQVEDIEASLKLLYEVYVRAHEANVEKIIEDIGSERRAHRLIEGLVQKFSLIGCGYFAQEDVERELEREMSVRDYEQLKEDLASYHDFEATRHKSLETILGETI